MIFITNIYRKICQDFQDLSIFVKIYQVLARILILCYHTLMFSTADIEQQKRLLAREEDFTCDEDINDLDLLLLNGISPHTFFIVLTKLKDYQDIGISLKRLSELTKLKQSFLQKIVVFLTELECLFESVIQDTVFYYYRSPGFLSYTIYHPQHKFFIKYFSWMH